MLSLEEVIYKKKMDVNGCKHVLIGCKHVLTGCKHVPTGCKHVLTGFIHILKGRCEQVQIGCNMSWTVLKLKLSDYYS